MSKMCPITKSVVLYTECVECDTKECRGNNHTSDNMDNENCSDGDQKNDKR